MKQLQWRGLGEVYWPKWLGKWVESVRIMAKGTVYRHYTVLQVDKTLSREIGITNSNTAIPVHWKWKTK